jgi:hypothetical protein
MSSNLRDTARETLARKASQAVKPVDPIGGVDNDSEAAVASEVAAEFAGNATMLDDYVAAVSYESALTMKSFLPDARFLATEMAGQPRDAVKVPLGRIMGTVRDTKPRETIWEGKPLRSIELQGSFDALVFHDENMLSAKSLFLGNTFAEKIDASLREAKTRDPNASILIDIEVGVKSTGKVIAHTWTLRHFLKDDDAAKRLAMLRAPRQLAGHKPRLIEGTVAAE